jgi:type II secretory pathway component HofQ
MSPKGATALLLLAALAGGPGEGDAPVAGEEAEARLSIDVKDAPIQSIVAVLVELGGRQVVFDPGLDCALTLKLHEVSWLSALELTLKACGLGYEEEGEVLWVATVARLREEAESRRRLREARPVETGQRLALYRLSWARAEEMAPLLRRRLGPEGEVTVEPRTNTLIIRY